MQSTKALSQKISILLGRNYSVLYTDQNTKLKSTESLSQSPYVDEPHLDLIQYVTRAFVNGIVTNLEKSLLWYLATNYSEQQLRRLPLSAISHLVDVRFIRDLDGGVSYEIRPKKIEYTLHIPQED